MVQVQRRDEALNAEHGAVCSLPEQFYGYFGWPCVARLENGALLVAASGLRHEHICPFGRSVVCRSDDEGRTWTTPRVVNDTPFDDRDAGLTALGGARVLLSWFTSDNRHYHANLDEWEDQDRAAVYRAGRAWMDDEGAARFVGSWVRRSADGGLTWEEPVRVPVTAPHGPIRRADGTLLYFGKIFGRRMEDLLVGARPVEAWESADEGKTWSRSGRVPVHPGTHVSHYHEPHAVELADGRLLGHIRFQNHRDPEAAKVEDLGLTHFSIMQTVSDDGGRTWSTPEPLGFHGSPPHLLRHSSGALVSVYGRREEPYGERVMISRDDGASWDYDLILRDDGPHWDLGYPSTAELADGSLLTVYYQKPAATADRCALLWSRWHLPEA